MSKRHVRKKAARVARGGKPRWRTIGRDLQRENMALRADIQELLRRGPAEGERFVRCSEELVDQLKAAPSQPVTLELHFVATVHADALAASVLAETIAKAPADSTVEDLRSPGSPLVAAVITPLEPGDLGEGTDDELAELSGGS